MIIEFLEYVMYFIFQRVTDLWQPEVNTKLQVKTIKINPNSCISIDKYTVKSQIHTQGNTYTQLQNINIVNTFLLSGYIFLHTHKTRTHT